MIERCPICNAVLALVGFRHRCVPRSDGDQEEGSAPLAYGQAKAPLPSAGADAGVAPRPSEPVIEKKRAPKGSFDKVAYQREYMKKKRAKEKGNERNS